MKKFKDAKTEKNDERNDNIDLKFPQTPNYD